MKYTSLVLSSMVLFSQAIWSQLPRITGFAESQLDQQYQWEKSFEQELHAGNIDRLVKELSSRPHHIGSPGGKAVAEYLQRYFTELGFETRVEKLYTLFSSPKERLLELNSPVPFKAGLSEPSLKEDATSGLRQEQLPIYNCWSADGDVTAPLVFVNYGLPEDYETLRQMGIEVAGKIVIAKYGRSWRGIKPKVAQEHGAIGCLIYSDPMDDGYFQGDVYPKGAFKNEFGAQRGSVMDMPIYPGDPLTPGYGHTENAETLDRSKVINLLKIPVLPISYHDAAPLLKALAGPVAPKDWRGALPFTYHVGPSASTVHLKLAFHWEIKPLLNVIAQLKGSQFPDQWIVRGNHHDAWVFGASDPISGMAALMEEARALSVLMKKGWKPKRTIVYCGWDGEEPGLLGSTEWVETHAKELQEKVVTYINSDGNGRGFLGAAGSHALEPFVNEVARDVTDPQTQISILERERSRSITAASSIASKKTLLAKSSLTLGALGSGSDYSPFFQHLGIPVLNVGFGGEDEGGEYHSIYDSYDHYKRFKDPQFAYGVALAKTAGKMTLRLSEAQLLPFDFTALQKTIAGYSQEVIVLLDQLRETTDIENRLIEEGRYTQSADPMETYFPPVKKAPVPYLDFSAWQNNLQEMEKKCNALQQYLNKNKQQPLPEEFNKSLFQAEQQFLLREGLPRRNWYRHSIYAPGFYTGYGVKTLPGIREAIEQRNWKEAQEQIAEAAAALQRFNEHISRLLAASPNAMKE